MAEELALEKYIKKFQTLRVAPGKDLYTTGKAPHKAVLLLSLITLHKNGKIDLNKIIPDVYLRETWVELWKLLEYEKPGSLHLPLYHLKSGGFWNIHLKPGYVETAPKSIKQFDNMVESVSLDPQLIQLIDNPESQAALINALLNGGYFSETEIVNLTRAISQIDRSFIYEEKIVAQISEEFTMVPTTTVSDFPEACRSASFRRNILENYEETCAVCGIRFITSSGISIIDAAHILPFSKFRNDNVRNGMALCKTHHWLFDSGLLSVDERYRVMVTDSIEIEMPEKVISRYHKEPIILPKEAARYPSQVALEWHRGKVFCG